MSDYPISIRGLSVSYYRKVVLSNIFLEIESGQVTGVIGPNGAGKSTLFKAILGLINSNTGQVLIHGKPVEEQRKNIVYVPQRDDVDWDFPATVLDVVLMGRYPHKKLFSRISGTDIKYAKDAMNEIGISHLSDRQIGELSGGQQQRVFLARALCQGADIYLLDEPFVGVDATTEEKIIIVMKKLASEGKTVLIIHHDLSTVPSYFDQVIMLNQRLVTFGKTEIVFTEENISKAYSGQLPILHQTGMI